MHQNIHSLQSVFFRRIARIAVNCTQQGFHSGKSGEIWKRLKGNLKEIWGNLQKRLKGNLNGNLGNVGNLHKRLKGNLEGNLEIFQNEWKEIWSGTFKPDDFSKNYKQTNAGQPGSRSPAFVTKQASTVRHPHPTSSYWLVHVTEVSRDTRSAFGLHQTTVSQGCFLRNCEIAWSMGAGAKGN